VSLFSRKPETQIAPSTALTVAPSVPPTPSHAPKAIEIEAQVRAAIWGHLSPELGRVANLDVAGLLEFCSGARRLSAPDVMALGRAIGVVHTPETGVDRLRKALAARMTKRLNFDWLEFPGGGRGEDNLRDFIAGADCLTLPELNHICREICGRHTEVDSQTAMIKSNAPPPTPMCGPGHGVPWSKGSNIPGLNEKMLDATRAKLRELEMLVAAGQG
jgi:hypothetical protein